MTSRDSHDEIAEVLREANISSNSIGTAIEILASIEEVAHAGDLPKDPRDWRGGEGLYSPTAANINLIPSEHTGECHELLVTLCAGEKSFDLNTMETIALCIRCRSSMRVVIIATDYWSEGEFNRWRRSSFEALHREFGINFFVYTLHAGRWSFDRVVPSKTQGKKRK